MKSIEVRFSVARTPVITDGVRDRIYQRHPTVAQDDVRKLWDNAVPPREKLTIELSRASVTFMDDWECRIMASSFPDCFAAFVTIHRTLKATLTTEIEFEFITPSEGHGWVEAEIRRQQVLSWVRGVNVLVAGAAIGVAIDRVV